MRKKDKKEAPKERSWPAYIMALHYHNKNHGDDKKDRSRRACRDFRPREAQDE